MAVVRCCHNAKRCVDSYVARDRRVPTPVFPHYSLWALLLTSLLVTLEAPFAEAAVESVAAPVSTFRVTFVVRNLAGGASGNFTVRVHPEWAPLGARRFARLVSSRFFDGCHFFRVVKKFVAQFGIPGEPKLAAQWRGQTLRDDKVVTNNFRGRMTFATSGANSRTTQMFINLKDNYPLDHKGFAPFAEIVAGMHIVDQLYNGYGDFPDQGRIESFGNKYLGKQFPKLSFIETAVLDNHTDVMGLLSEETSGSGLDNIGVKIIIVAFASFPLIIAVVVVRSLCCRSPRIEKTDNDPPALGLGRRTVAGAAE